MVLQFCCNFEQIRCKWGLHSTASWFQMGSWSTSTPIFRKTLWSSSDTSIPTLNQNSSPQGIAAWTPDIVSAIPCPLVKRSPGKYDEAAVLQRSRFLRWPIGPKRPRTNVKRCQTFTGRGKTGDELCRSGKLPLSHRSHFVVLFKTFGAVKRTIIVTERIRYFLHGVQRLLNGNEGWWYLFTAPGMLQQSSCCGPWALSVFRSHSAARQAFKTLYKRCGIAVWCDRGFK